MPLFRPAQGSAEEWLGALGGLINPLATIISKPILRGTLRALTNTDKHLPGGIPPNAPRLAADPEGMFSMMFGRNMRGDNARLLPPSTNKEAYEYVLAKRLAGPTSDEFHTYLNMLRMLR